MKLLRYGPAGQEKPGVVDVAGNVRDLSHIVPDIAGDVLLPESIKRLKGIDFTVLPRVGADVRLGACVGKVGKVICVGLNYADHAAESGMSLPTEPVLFMKATSALCGPNDDVVIPRGSTKTDWEVEMAVIIGKPAKYVREKDAWSHVAGYCVMNDLSERSFQLEGTGQWVKGKSADTFAPLGPFLATRDEIPDTGNLAMWLKVNDVFRQRSSTNQMIFDVPTLVSYVSQFMTLLPGDIISTGTPAGVALGMKPPQYLKAGDVVELGIERLGESRQTVVAWQPAAIEPAFLSGR